MRDSEKSTQVLREEHRLIESALLSFAGIIKRFETGAALEHRRVWEIAQSFKTYVLRWHHAEEDLLLSMVRARGVCSQYPSRAFYEEHQHFCNTGSEPPPAPMKANLV